MKKMHKKVNDVQIIQMQNVDLFKISTRKTKQMLNGLDFIILKSKYILSTYFQMIIQYYFENIKKCLIYSIRKTMQKA
jgi:hypothetical protein